MGRDKHTLTRDFHMARWNEDMIFEMSVPGERGILVPQAPQKIVDAVGDGLSQFEPLKREKAPALPEVNQMRVNRHFMRLSQETLGADLCIDISQGTCTMKYSPKVQEHLAARHPGITEIHPLQDDDTIQGILEMYYKFESFLREISGLDYFSFEPGGGAQGVYANACIVRAYHADREDYNRDEIITTMFSHPCDAASPATAGYKVITLMPNEDGLPDLEAMQAALTPRTAGIFITNPEDTGIYNSKIDAFVKAAHDAGALCSYDQANANGLLGIARAKEAGFDLCHFNVHKTFSAPHGCMGPAMGAIGVTEELSKYLPVPWIEFDGKKYYLDAKRPHSIGKVRSFFGNAPLVLKAYAWIMQLGADGLREVAQCAVLNNNYLEKKIREIPGVEVWYAEGKRRLEQVRYSWKKLQEDTGVNTDDISRRITDYGLQHYHTSHHPYVVPEPFTLEPCESYSKDDIDEYAAIYKRVSREAYEKPEFVQKAPYNAPIHKVKAPAVNEPEGIVVTWRQWLKKKNERGL